MTIYTEDQLQEVKAVIAAMIRAQRITDNRVAYVCAASELKRLDGLYGKDTMTAIARELDARAPLGGQSSPASQGEDQ